MLYLDYLMSANAFRLARRSDIHMIFSNQAKSHNAASRMITIIEDSGSNSENNSSLSAKDLNVIAPHYHTMYSNLWSVGKSQMS